MIDRCMFCRTVCNRGSYIIEHRRGVYVGVSCRSETDCFNRVLKQRDELLRIGNPMSNILYNFAQHGGQPIQFNEADSCKEWYTKWDKAKRESGL